MRLDCVSEASGAEADRYWRFNRSMLQEDHNRCDVVNGASLLLTPAGVGCMHQLQHSTAQQSTARKVGQGKNRTGEACKTGVTGMLYYVD